MLSAEDLSGSVAIITGASSGIGEATAVTLARGGVAVVLAARREDRLRQLAERITAEGGTAVAMSVDVTRRDAATAIVEHTLTTYGRIDIVVNNAGRMLLGPVLDAPRSEWDDMIRLNTQAAVDLVHASLPHLIDAAKTSPRGVADLVNVSSAAGRKARAGSAVYALTKFGLGGFSEALRQEMSTHHVRVATVEPGAVETELREHIRPEIQAAARNQPTIERMEPEDIADLIAYVVSRPRRMALNEILVRPTEQAD